MGLAVWGESLGKELKAGNVFKIERHDGFELCPSSITMSQEWGAPGIGSSLVPRGQEPYTTTTLLPEHCPCPPRRQPSTPHSLESFLLHLIF